MKKKNRLSLLLGISCLLLLVFTFLCLSCGKKPTEKGPKYENALYIYFCGSNLETKRGACSQNIEELLSSKIPDSTAVIIETGGTRKWRHFDIPSDTLNRYRIKDGKLEFLESVPGSSMGDSTTLKQFLLYGEEHYSAKNTGVILWNHGGGGLDGVCFDELHGMDSLSLTELGDALEAYTDTSGKKLDFLGFDACLMGNFETLYTVYPYTESVIASEEIEPLYGWDYTDIPNCFTTPDKRKEILTAYREKCEKNNEEFYTLSLYDTAGFPRIIREFTRFTELISRSDNLKDTVMSARDALSFGGAGRSSSSSFIDLVGFSRGMEMFSLDRAVRESVITVTGEARKGASGLSLFYPMQDVEKNVEKYLSQPMEEHYLNFLRTYYLEVPESKEYFENRGENVNNHLQIALDSNSLPLIYDIKYQLFRFISTGTDYLDRVIYLGDSGDLFREGNRFSAQFQGKWVTLEGEFITCALLDEHSGLYLYSTPIRKNGIDGDLIFSFFAGEKQFRILGFHPESSTEAYNRLVPFVPGDKVTLLYDDRTDSYTENLVEGKTFFFNAETRIEPKALGTGYYQYCITVKDVYGREESSKDCVLYFDGKDVEIQYLGD